MSGGPVGNGVSYWANIRISGNLNAQQLQAVKMQIQNILSGQGVNGSIVTEARASDSNSTVTLNVTY